MDDILVYCYDKLRGILTEIETLSKLLNNNEENGIKIDTLFDNQTRIFQIEKELNNFQYIIDNFGKVDESFKIIKEVYFKLVVSKLVENKKEEKAVNEDQYPKSPGVTVIQSEDNKIGDFVLSDDSNLIKNTVVSKLREDEEEVEIYHE